MTIAALGNMWSREGDNIVVTLKWERAREKQGAEENEQTDWRHKIADERGKAQKSDSYKNGKAKSERKDDKERKDKRNGFRRCRILPTVA